MAYVIAAPCIDVKDTACVDACPFDCIGPKKGEAGPTTSLQLYIDPELCTDCGACIPACPVSAIYPEADLPPEWEHFAKINAEYWEKHRVR